VRSPVALRVGLLLLFFLSSIASLLMARPPVHPWLFILGAGGMFASMIVLSRLWPEENSLVPPLVVALLVRALFIAFFPAGDDVNRYVWEGRIQNHGFNPFVTPPNAPETAMLRDTLWQGVNHKDLPAIYGPFAQILFRVTAAIAPGITGFKLLVSIFDVATLFLLLFVVRKRKLPLRHSLLYAMNPLVIIFISGQGHLESMVTCMALCALVLSETRYRSFAYAAFACAVLTKLPVLILLPFFIRAIGFRRLAFLFFPLVLFAFYGRGMENFFGTPLLFLRQFSYNGLFNTIFLQVPGFDSVTTRYALSVVLFVGMGGIFFLTPSLLPAAGQALGLLLLSLPTVHPWYFALMTPFLVFFRRWSWASLHFTAIFPIFVFDQSVHSPFFHNCPMLMAVEYLPFLLLGVRELLIGNKHWPVRYSAPASMSVVVPVRNEEQHISACIESILRQDIEAEIIVVDGGSSDNTLPKVREYPMVKIRHSTPGRGVQIASGAAYAGGDLIMVLHADSRLTQGALRKVVEALRGCPDAAGGAMGACYDPPSSRFKMTGLLNNLRARLTGISFGDQAQFYRKSALPQGFPEFRLMEDVELSLRLKAQGALLFIPAGVSSSPRRWDRIGYARNFLTVSLLTGIFLFLRGFNVIRDNGEWFYRRYYGNSG